VAWELRRKNRLYYYYVHRNNGELKKCYFGSGRRAVEKARKVRKRRQLAAHDLELRRELESQLWAVDRRMRLIQEGCRTLLHAVYLVAGYRQSNSRNWRKVRQMDHDSNKKPEAVPPKKTAATGPEPTQKTTDTPRTFLETVAAIKAALRDADGETSRDFAATNGHTEVVRLLSK
jgi:hypothetical protein